MALTGCPLCYYGGGEERDTPMLNMSGDRGLSRRAFLGGTLALTAAVSLPLNGLARVPVIYGDGFHNDTLGLQAALRGEPFKVMREGLAISRGGTLWLNHGTFKLSDTIRPTARVPLVSLGNHYDFSSTPKRLDCGFDLRHANGSHFENDYFDGGGKLDYGIRAPSYVG